MKSKEGFRYRALRTLARTVHRFAWPIVLVALLGAVGSTLLALFGLPSLGIKKLAFTGNPNDLLSSDASYHRNYLAYTAEFRAEEDYVIVVQGPDFEHNKQCIESIAGKLRENPELFKKVFYRIDFQELSDRGLLFLDEPQLKEIEKGIGEFTSMLGKQDLQLDLNSMLVAAHQQLDPKHMKKEGNWENMQGFLDQFVNSLNAMADRLEGKQEKQPPRFGNFIQKNSNLDELQKQQAQHEYLSFDHGKILLLLIGSPNKEASFGDHAYIIDPLKKILQQTRSEFPDLEIGLTGEPAMSEDESLASQRDTTVSSIVTFVLIALLFWFSFREFSRPALALLTLVIAVCWCIGFTTLFIGRLNMLSLTFVPMILGLGIDFGIQILGRYEEELPKSSDVIAAIIQTLMHTGNAIIIGASTTAAAFYTMCLNDFTGLAEMGAISGTGIILCVIASLVLLPALLSLRDRRGAEAREVPVHAPKGKQHFFDRLVVDHAWTIIGVSVVLTILAFTQFRKLWFDYNLLNLQDPHLESVRFERMLTDNAGSRSVIFAAHVSGSLKEAEAKAEQFKKLPSVKEVISVTEMVPQNQEEKLKIIGRIKRKLEKIRVPKPGIKVNVTENIEALNSLLKKCSRFERLSRQFGYKEESKVFGHLIPPIERALKVLGSMDQKQAEEILTSYQRHMFGDLQKNLEWLKRQKVDRPVTEKDVPSSLHSRFIGKSGKVLIEVYPRENIWDREPLTRFVKDLRTVDPNITGTPVQNYEYIELLRVSYEQAALYALVAIVILISAHFRNPKYVIPTLLPLVLGMIWTAGLMPLFGIPFNPANIITLPLVVGIGVAYGVYAVDRYRENSSPRLFSTSTGKAILLSALTTIFGFGSLAFASHQGIASLGLLMTVSITMCLITSLYVCPAILKVIGRRPIKSLYEPQETVLAESKMELESHNSSRDSDTDPLDSLECSDALKSGSEK